MIKSIQRSLLALIAIGAAGAAIAQAPPYVDSGNAASFDTAIWGVDRYAPNNWSPNIVDPTGGRALRVHIDNADRRNMRPSNFNTSFYDTQGRVRDNGFKATEVGGKVYIPSSWQLQGNLRQVALWSRDTNMDESWAYYPIISFVNNDPTDPFNPLAVPQPRFRIWDSTTGWVDKPAIPINYNAYNSFKIKDTGHSHQFWINNALVEELSGDSYSLPDGEGLKQIALEATNFGNETNTSTLPSSNYDVYWKDVYASDYPTANDTDITVDVNSSVDIAPYLIDNASSPNDRTLFLDNWTQPNHGTLTVVGGKLQYTVTNYDGQDSFNYTITDAYGQTATATAHITVQTAKPDLLVIAPNAVTGGNGSTGTITMDHALQTGTYVVALSSSDPTVASVPSTMTITTGDTGTFPITTTQVLSDATVQISATYNGKTVKKNILVKPLKLLSATLTPSSVYGGVADSNLQIQLEAAPTLYPVTVNVVGNNDAAADLDGVTTVTFNVGESTKSISVDTHVVAANTNVVFTTSLDAVSKSATLAVAPVRIKTIAASNKTLAPGDSGIATVTIDHTLLAGESVDVAISSPGGILSHVSSVTITGGNSTTFVYAAPATSIGYKAIVPLNAKLGPTKFVNITVLKK